MVLSKTDEIINIFYRMGSSHAPWVATADSFPSLSLCDFCVPIVYFCVICGRRLVSDLLAIENLRKQQSSKNNINDSQLFRIGETYKNKNCIFAHAPCSDPS